MSVGAEYVPKQNNQIDFMQILQWGRTNEWTPDRYKPQYPRWDMFLLE